MSDGGIGFGAAIAKAVDNGISYFNWNNTMLLGPQYSFDQSNLQNYTVENFQNIDRCSKKTVELILEGKIAGVFTGHMEYGPRALGSRSIIFETKNKIVNDTINKRLNRTEFMPFAPVTLESEASKMYIDYTEDFNTNFMTTCYNCTDEMKKISPAVVHVDNTARPQIISKDNSNELYYKILNTYFEKTGIPNLVNTSFNNHEEPIVCTPLDALDSLEKNNVDFIVTDTIIIMKKG
jgi:carbamoyltransferase